jgi:hypothetical protein
VHLPFTSLYTHPFHLPLKHLNTPTHSSPSLIVLDTKRIVQAPTSKRYPPVTSLALSVQIRLRSNRTTFFPDRPSCPFSSFAPFTHLRGDPPLIVDFSPLLLLGQRQKQVNSHQTRTNREKLPGRREETTGGDSFRPSYNLLTPFPWPPVDAICDDGFLLLFSEYFSFDTRYSIENQD